MSDARNHVEELINESTKGVKSLESALINAYATSNTKQIDTYTPLFKDAIYKLELVCPPTVKPLWVSNFKQILQAWGQSEANNQNLRSTLFTLLIKHHEAIESFTSEYALSSPILNVDSIIIDAVKEFKLDELYLSAISTLKDFISNGAIDSSKILNDLQGLLDTLIASQKSPYHTKATAGQFVKTYIKNLSVEIFNGSKFGKAFTKTIDELDISVINTINKVHLQTELIAENRAVELNKSIKLLNPPEEG